MVGETSTILANRAAWLKKWTLRAAQLSGAERALHQSLAPHCSAVLKGKRLLLFGEMLRDISYPDTHLVEDICAGFRVTGWLRDSGCFEKLPKQPSLTVTGLLGMSRGLNRSVLARASASEEDEMVRAAWDETQLEVEREWIWRDDSHESEGLSLTHRFGLQQKKKVRVIDNFKTSGVNARATPESENKRASQAKRVGRQQTRESAGNKRASQPTTNARVRPKKKTIRESPARKRPKEAESPARKRPKEAEHPTDTASFGPLARWPVAFLAGFCIP